MTITGERSAAGNHRERIAANVRAELARAQVKPSHLPKLVGGSQSYWSRRVNGELPFDTDHLADLAALLRVDIRAFLDVDADRSAGNIYFHGNEFSHSGQPDHPTNSPVARDLGFGIAS